MKKLFLVSSIFIFILVLFPIKKEVEINQSKFNIYLESTDKYIKSDSNKFPKKGFTLNTGKSSCENGSTISQNESTKEINLEVSKSDKCNLYFDAESNVTLNKLHSLNNSIELKTTTLDFSKTSPLPTEYRDNGMGTTEENYTIPINTNYITYADSYTFNPSTGRYALTNPRTCKWSECYSILTGKYLGHVMIYDNATLHNYDNLVNVYQITANSAISKLYYKQSSKEITNYSTENAGLFKSNDDYGESMYFRGNATNNYVKFGKNKNNQDMYWRIIRINGDGTLRLLYDGTEAHANADVSNDRKVGDSTFNSNPGSPYDIGYAGYMYGNFDAPVGCTCESRDSGGNCIYTCTSGGSTTKEEAFENINDSTIKVYLDAWYEENIKDTGYSNYIADEIFCNDKSFDETSDSFNVYKRINITKNPSLKCALKRDSFTYQDTNYGNGKLTYPIGLITADELAFSGNVMWQDQNTLSFTYKGIGYWSMSPHYLHSGGYLYIISLYYNGNLASNWTVSTNGVVPVINLKTEYISQLTGNGTKNNPFKLE